MRLSFRTVGVLLLLALVSGAAANRVVNVTNPFTADVDGNGYSLYNLGGLSATSIANVTVDHAVVVGLSPMEDADPSARGRVVIGDGG